MEQIVLKTASIIPTSADCSHLSPNRRNEFTTRLRPSATSYIHDWRANMYTLYNLPPLHPNAYSPPQLSPLALQVTTEAPLGQTLSVHKATAEQPIAEQLDTEQRRGRRGARCWIFGAGGLRISGPRPLLIKGPPFSTFRISLRNV